ncbi:hypothetical protein LCGC14_2389880, partial [marine sediment metagenome]
MASVNYKLLRDLTRGMTRRDRPDALPDGKVVTAENV